MASGGSRWKSSHGVWMEFPFSAGGHQGSIFSPTLFLLYNDDLPDDVISISGWSYMLL